MNLYGQDMDETKNPLESGLAWTVDLKSETDFIGKQALLNTAVLRNNWWDWYWSIAACCAATSK